MELPMRNVVGVACAPARNRRVRSRPTDERRRVASFVGPALASIVVSSFGLHLLAELVALLPEADPLGALSVLAGMMAVLAIVMPFTILWACRAQRVWAAFWSSPRPGARSSVP